MGTNQVKGGNSIWEWNPVANFDVQRAPFAKAAGRSCARISTLHAANEGSIIAVGGLDGEFVILDGNIRDIEPIEIEASSNLLVRAKLSEEAGIGVNHIISQGRENILLAMNDGRLISFNLGSLKFKDVLKHKSPINVSFIF